MYVNDGECFILLSRSSHTILLSGISYIDVERCILVHAMLMKLCCPKIWPVFHRLSLMAFTTKKRFCAKCIHDQVDDAQILSTDSWSMVGEGSMQLHDLQLYDKRVKWMAVSWALRNPGVVFLHHSGNAPEAAAATRV